MRYRGSRVRALAPGIALAFAAALAGCGGDTGGSGPFGCTTEDPALEDLPGGPWICPNQGYLTWCDQIAGMAYRGNVILSNRGGGALEISDVRIRGDLRCSFRSPVVDVMTVGPNGAAFVEFDYFPQSGCAAAACDDPDTLDDPSCFDRVALEVDSNAGNFATLVVPVCGRAVADAAAACAGCASCDAPAADVVDPACAPE